MSQITTNTRGDFHHGSKSPQVFVVILFMVGSTVREHYESIVGCSIARVPWSLKNLTPDYQV